MSLADFDYLTRSHGETSWILNCSSAVDFSLCCLPLYVGHCVLPNNTIMCIQS